MCCGGFVGDVWDAATGLVEDVVEGVVYRDWETDRKSVV